MSQPPAELSAVMIVSTMLATSGKIPESLRMCSNSGLMIKQASAPVSAPAAEAPSACTTTELERLRSRVARSARGAPTIAVAGAAIIAEHRDAITNPIIPRGVKAKIAAESVDTPATKRNSVHKLEIDTLLTVSGSGALTVGPSP